MGQAAGRHLVLAMRFADNPTGTAHPDRIRTGNGTSFDLAGGRFVVKPDLHRRYRIIRQSNDSKDKIGGDFFTKALPRIKHQQFAPFCAVDPVIP